MKYNGKVLGYARFKVAPLIGTGIEIQLYYLYPRDRVVALLIGAWIEITQAVHTYITLNVAPLLGARIEISVAGVR
ncbi:hypothetical protein [Bacillus thuringiensis]|uniref:hypothetical protein n=1 Tax=Bacillus thuringiensis TaxID=1428 RepID=UPI000BF8A0EB|nr:hypothetical protein [Bacillus thuringiensis]PEW28187.1 hypothetical protein CN427_12555 [Bacillus thuringiensis]